MAENNVEDSFGPLISELQALQKQFKESMEEGIDPVLKSCFFKLFEKIPRLKGVRWAQYTPYFNDGDQCEFGIQGFEYFVADDERSRNLRIEETERYLSDSKIALEKAIKSNDYYNVGYYTKYVAECEQRLEKLKNPPPESEDVYLDEIEWEDAYDSHLGPGEKEIVEEFETAIEKIESLLELVYGDNIQVSMLRGHTGIDTDEYEDHD